MAQATRPAENTPEYFGAVHDRLAATSARGEHLTGLAREMLAMGREAYTAHMMRLVEQERISRAAAKARKAAAKAAKVKAKASTTAQRTADTKRKARLAEALAYAASYTGTWGLPLDIAADRRFGSKWMAVSDRQIDALLAGKARDLARAEDAQWARELYAADQYAQHLARQAADKAPAAQAVAPAATPGRVDQDGMYLTPDGVVYKVQVAKLGSGRLYAKRLVIEGQQGTFEYEAGAIYRLQPEWRMTLEQAAEYGRLYGVCVRCGSPLTDEVSIAAGIGPICAGRM